MKDTGLDIYGSGLVVKEEDIKKRPDFVRAYVEGTMEGLRYARDNQEEALQILLKQKPELDQALTTAATEERSVRGHSCRRNRCSRLGLHEAGHHGKDVRITNEYFDVARKVTSKEVFTNQFIKR